MIEDASFFNATEEQIALVAKRYYPIGTCWYEYLEDINSFVARGGVYKENKMSPEELYSKTGPTPSERAVVTCEQGEIRIFVYHGSDRLSALLTRERATAIAHDLLSKVLESSR